MVYFTKMKMTKKFHYSCFDFMCKVMASGQMDLDLEALGPLPNMYIHNQGTQKDYLTTNLF
jgi:hypothetical protein